MKEKVIAASASMKEKLQKYKKKIIVTASVIVALGLAGAGTFGGIVYKYAKDNLQYSEQQIREIAGKQIEGEIINIQKEFEMDEDQLSRSEYQYEVEIKTPDNLLQELTISSRTGTIEIDD